MNILLAHNYYQQRGGEDQVFAAEADLLSARGHSVERFTTHNDRIDGMRSLELFRATLWNLDSQRAVRGVLRKRRPDVAHFHNTFPLISPAVYFAAHAERVAVVQTLHNYRLLCPNALFYRDGRVCESCLGKQISWPGVVYACYRGSQAASGTVATMLAFHRAIGTWSGGVDVYIALTEFARRKFIDGGLPSDRIVVKPNFIHPDPGEGDGRGDLVLFVGRLSPEKGINTLLKAWGALTPQLPLRIIGDGPCSPAVSEVTEACPSVRWLGRLPSRDVHANMREATVLILSSEWYEACPTVILEAFAAGTPVIAANLGAMAELVDHGRTGLLFRAGDPEDLATKVEWAWTHPRELAAMRREARAEYEAKYTAERNYQMLMEIYRLAIERQRGRA